MEDIDIDDYSRDRSPPPARNRSRSPSQRRDYEAPRDGGRSDYRHDRSDSRSSRGRGDDRRGGFRRDSGRDAGRVDRRAATESINRNYDNSIFIGNIPFESTTRDVEKMFGLAGRIVHAGVISNKGRSRGMAFVEFDNKHAANEAIRRFDHTSLNGREIFVRQDLPPPEDRRRDDRDRGDSGDRRDRRDDSRRNDRRDNRPRDRRDRPVFESPRPGTEVFVGNLPFSTTWHTLKDIFRDVGDVVRADVMTSKFGKSRGFGTVIFSNSEDADNAVEKLQNYTLEGRTLEIRHGKNPEERGKSSAKNSDFTMSVFSNGEPSSVIFVGNLPYITSQTDLFELFQTIGSVSRAEIQYNDSGRPSGNAVVEFELPDLAELAIKNLDRYNYGGRELEISFASFPNGQAPGPVDDKEQAMVTSDAGEVATEAAEDQDLAEDVPAKDAAVEDA